MPDLPAPGSATSPDFVGDVGVAAFPLAADAVEVAELERLLSRAERDRAAAFAAAIRPGYVAGRARLRKLLAAVLGEDPAALEIATGGRGKPELAGRHAGRLHFNVSHSRGACLVAVSRRHPVGVDLELRAADHTGRWAEQMAGAILAAEELDRHRRLPEGARPAALLEAWVAKEAVLKAEGTGIGAGVRHVVVPAGLPRVRLADAPAPVAPAPVAGCAGFGVCLLDAPVAAGGEAFAALAWPAGGRIVVTPLIVPW
jgi:4'-phosphopantetheinyl transferase